MSEGDQFFAFPRTPHLAGSAVVDDDEVVNENALLSLLLLRDREAAAEDKRTAADPLTLVVQEKMDGTNVSLYFDAEWSPVLQKRSGLITSGAACPSWV